jgi:hypothetical protein
MPSRFLFNQALWNELKTRIAKAKMVRAAVAYIGNDAARMLRLREGDKLVVDMSLPRIRRGGTDPREIRKFMRDKVEVFSRASLHAKFFIIDNIVIVGSSNISKHARDNQDEAAILTDDPAVLARALQTFELLCTEPVRKEYLKKCIAEYHPPLIAAVRQGNRPRRKRTLPPKVWIISGLDYGDVPERESSKAKRAVDQAEKKLHRADTEVEYVHSASKLDTLDFLHEGDWAIQCTRNGKVYDVSAPCQYLEEKSYARGSGKRRYLQMFEVLKRQKDSRWSDVRKRARHVVPILNRLKPRTLPIRDPDQADALLRLWSSRGVLLGRKRRRSKRAGRGDR